MKKMLEEFCKKSNGKCLDLENPDHNKLKRVLWIMSVLLMGLIVGLLFFYQQSSPAPIGPFADSGDIAAFGWWVFIGIAFVGIIFGIIPSCNHYFIHYKDFKESAKNWVSAEDELKSIKKYEKNKNGLYSSLFICFHICVSLIFIYVSYITLLLLYTIEANSAIQTSSVLSVFNLWFWVLVTLLFVFWVYIMIFLIYVKDPEKFQESMDKFKKRKEAKKDVS